MKFKRAPIFFFVLAMGIQAAVMGIGLLAEPAKFTSPAYRTLFELLPTDIIALWLTISGVIMVISFMQHSLLLARIGLVAFGTYLGMEATSFFIEYLDNRASIWASTRAFTLMIFCGIGAFFQFQETRN